MRFNLEYVRLPIKKDHVFFFLHLPCASDFEDESSLKTNRVEISITSLRNFDNFINKLMIRIFFVRPWIQSPEDKQEGLRRRQGRGYSCPVAQG